MGINVMQDPWWRLLGVLRRRGVNIVLIYCTAYLLAVTRLFCTVLLAVEVSLLALQINACLKRATPSCACGYRSKGLGT